MATYLYAVRDADTGKLVSDITNPARKYWDREGSAINAIKKHMSHKYRKHRELLLVQFELVPFCEREVYELDEA